MDRKLTEEQSTFLQANHKLLYMGIKKKSSNRKLMLTEDEVSDCVYKVLRQFCTHDPSKSKESTYIYSNCDFAIRKITSDRETFSKRPSYIQSEDVVLYEKGHEIPYKESMSEDLVVDLQDALARLPPLWLDILQRRILQGDTYPQLALHFNRSNSWVQTIVNNALLQLKMELYHWRQHDQCYPD